MAIFTISVLLSLPAIRSPYEGRVDSIGMPTAREIASILLGKLTQNQRSMIPTLVHSNIELANAISITIVGECDHKIPDKDVKIFVLEIANQIQELEKILQ